MAIDQNQIDDQNSINGVEVTICVVIGSAFIPIHQLLRMGRGAVIELDADETTSVTICANFIPIALGVILLRNEQICVQVDRLL